LFTEVQHETGYKGGGEPVHTKSAIGLSRNVMTPEAVSRQTRSLRLRLNFSVEAVFGGDRVRKLDLNNNA
jgi:hypothetical protein